MTSNSNWTHYNPVRMVVGPVEHLRDLFSERNILIVTTRGMVRRGVVARVTQALAPASIQIWDEVKSNPDLDDLDFAAKRFRGTGIDLLIGLGGGSAIDAAKSLAFLLAQASAAVTLDSVLRRCQHRSDARSLELIAIPTTAGTGSEVTPFATVWDQVLQCKHSLSGDYLYPSLAQLDASLTVSLDYGNTLFPALDAISHSLESLWNRHRTPLSQACAKQSLALSVVALPRALADPISFSARCQMQEAAMLAGLAISQTKTAIAHAISYPLTLRYAMPHGLACSFTLPGLIERYKAAQPLEPIEASIVADVADLLAGLNLPEHALKFVTRTEGLAQVGQMFTPERAGNCSFHVNRNYVEHLLKTSLSR